MRYRVRFLINNSRYVTLTLAEFKHKDIIKNLNKGVVNMSTLEATVSMLEVMPEDARIKVFMYTQQLFGSRKPANPFTPASEERILSDLALSRQETADGKGVDAEEALLELGKQYGYV